MKTHSPNYFKVAALCCFALLLNACKPPAPGIYKNDKIASGQRSDFHDLNKEALTYLKGNKLKSVKLMMSKELMDETTTEQEVEVIGNDLTDNDYELADEYYVVTKDTSGGSLPIIGDDINRYGLKYPSMPAHERYFAFFLPKKGDNKQMITLMYAKLSYGWRIIDMDVESYTIDGKTGPELYQLGKEDYAHKYLVEAESVLSLAQACYTPSDIWQYPDADSLKNLSNKVMLESYNKYRFPFVLSGVSSGPRIERVYMLRNDHGTFPAVYYMTHYSIADTNAVKKENLSIQKALRQIMPGIGKDFKYILYSAYNKEPSSYDSIDHFDMTEQVK
jgi:hypothetical protein